MNSRKKNSGTKRVRRFRDVKQTNDFLRDWESLEASGQHDMQKLKEAMTLLAANDAPMPPEWKDHQLNGKLNAYRECHVKGDLLLMYRIEEFSKIEVVVFVKLTHSEMFSK